MTDAPGATGGTTRAPAPRRELGPVSAVVCNYQGERHLPPCLDALLALDPAPAEVLVVDNGSTDGSLALLRERYPQVRVVELAENRGPCAARNAGMREARHRWVLAVDNDAVLPPETLGALRAALEVDGGAVLAQPRSVVDHDPGTVHYDGARFHYVGLLSLRNWFTPLAEAEGRGTLEADAFIAICGLLDRDVVLDAGGYDESLFILFEDYDLSLRLRLAGHRLLSCEDVLVRHRSGTPGISFRASDYPAARAFFHSRNRWLLLVKCHRWRTLLLSLPALALYELVWLAFTIRSGHLGAWLRGKAAFCGGLPGALRHRRAIQRTRRNRDRDLLVGGPLTLSPQLVEKPLARRLATALDACLRGWWRVVRPLVP